MNALALSTGSDLLSIRVFPDSILFDRMTEDARGNPAQKVLLGLRTCRTVRYHHWRMTNGTRMKLTVCLPSRGFACY